MQPETVDFMTAIRAIRDNTCTGIRPERLFGTDSYFYVNADGVLASRFTNTAMLLPSDFTKDWEIVN